MVKKIFTVILIGCFLSFVITPAYAETEEEKAESDRQQGKAVLAAIGIVALVGAIYMLSKMGDSKLADSPIEKKRNTGKGFRFSVFNSQLESNFSAAKDEVRFPMMGITYTW